MEQLSQANISQLFPHSLSLSLSHALTLSLISSFSFSRSFRCNFETTSSLLQDNDDGDNDVDDDDDDLDTFLDWLVKTTASGGLFKQLDFNTRLARVFY